MSHNKIRAVVHTALKQWPRDAVAAAEHIAEGLVLATHGAVRPRKGWVHTQLILTVQSALDRAVGSLEQAALAICRDLAICNPFRLVEAGWFQDDPQVLAWHERQQAQWQAAWAA